MTGIKCKCGKGYASGWDGKCGNCRTKQEQREHERTMAAMPEYSPDAHATYRFLRWGK